MTRQGWVEVDLDGLQKLLERRGKEFAVFELCQNSFDEAGVTRVDVRLTKRGGTYLLEVEDDAPAGFSDLTDAYTRFAACYGSGDLKVNVTALGRPWFDAKASVSQLHLLIHEFAHDVEANHLDERYHEALAKFGAKFTRLALDEPEMFR